MGEPAPRPVYLDHQATTPVDPRVADAMLPWITEKFGNPASAGHVYGREARDAVEAARADVAALIGASSHEIVFTSGATEADNLAILGAGRQRAEPGHAITTAIEHKAVLEPCAALGREGWAITRVPPGEDGLLSAEAVAATLRDDTAIVSVMAANNEVGTLQPLEALGALCAERGILFHTDAAQMAGQLPLDVRAAGLSLASLSAHKMYGPKGVGALYVRSWRPRVRLKAVTFGGGHEQGLRPGTLPVYAIVGFGAAARIARESMAAAAERMRGLRDRLLRGLQRRLDGVEVNGDLDRRLPGNLNVSFEDIEAFALLASTPGVAFSAGSACVSAAFEPSHVLRAMGLSGPRIGSAVRLGLGRGTTEGDVDCAIDHIGAAVDRLRGADGRVRLAR